MRRILDVLSAVYNLGNLKLILSVSVGISHYPKDGVDLDVFIEYADAAMYSTKEQGGENDKW